MSLKSLLTKNNALAKVIYPSVNTTTGAILGKNGRPIKMTRSAQEIEAQRVKTDGTLGRQVPVTDGM